MPTLPAEQAESVAQTESGGGDFEAIAPGRYVVTLKDVQDVDKNGAPLVSGPKSKNPGTAYWHWMFTVDSEYHPKVGARVLHRNVSLGKTSEGMVKDQFAAFGYEPSTPTEKIVEDDARCVLYVVKKKVPYGAREGEWDNEVKRVVKFDPAAWKKPEDEEDETDATDWSTTPDEEDAADGAWDSDE